jgi:hypothetical protein
MNVQAVPQPSRAVFVHIDSPQPVSLQHKPPNVDDDFFSNVCTSPCDAYMDPAGECRVVPPSGVRASESFSVSKDLPRETIAVRPASQGFFKAGIAVSVLGGATMGFASVWGITDLVSTLEGHVQDQNQPDETWLIGAAVAVIGVGMILSNARTGVSHDTGANGDEAGSPRLREGAWREASSQERAIPRPVGLQLLRVAF